MLITELFRQLLIVSHEWRPTVVIGSFDIRTAFDSMDHELIFKALTGRGVAEHLAAAFIRELWDLQVEAEIPGMATTTGQPANVGGRQGGTETPSLWNYLLKYILEELVAKWNVRGWGFRFDNGPLVNHMIWAIYNNKLRWKGGELKYMTGTNVEGCGDYLTMMPDGEVLDIAYTEELEVLGVMLDRRGGATDTSIDHRLNKAEGNYGYMAKALKDKMAPPTEKLQPWSKGLVISRFMQWRLAVEPAQIAQLQTLGE